MILYSNSCSFGASGQGHKIYPEVVAESLSAELHNDGRNGCCNRRIIRSSLRSLIELTKTNKKITALIGLTFLGRTELWQPHLSAVDNDGDFHSISNQKIIDLDWSKGSNKTIISNIHEYADDEVKDYYKHWLIHYSKEGAITDLISDLIMLHSFATNNDIDILIFSNCERFPGHPEVDRQSPFLASLLDYVKLNTNIIDPWDFSFADFALERGYTPKDAKQFGLNGHPGKQAHEDFGKHLLKYV